jgi:hypothetical protein
VTELKECGYLENQMLHLTNLGANEIFGKAYMQSAVGDTGYKRRTAERRN